MANLAKILDDCVEKNAREETYNEEGDVRLDDRITWSDELAPLITTAKRLASVHRKELSPSARERIRARVFAQMKMYPLPVRRWAPWMKNQYRLAFGSLMFLLAFLTTGTGLAQTAWPGEILYPWKRASEQIYRMISADPLAVDLFLAERRSAEYLQANGDPESKEISLEGYRDALVRLAEYQDKDDQVVIQQNLEEQKALMERAGVDMQEIIILLDMEMGDVEPQLDTTPSPERDSTPDCERVRPACVP
jgi:hypothetical protein